MNMVDPAEKVNGLFRVGFGNGSAGADGKEQPVAENKVKKIIVQIYEIQEPVEAARLIEIGVDHIGSVVVSMSEWKIPPIRDTIDLIRGAGRQSSLILLFNQPETVYRALDYYQPDLLHFCEVLKYANGAADEHCRQLPELQAQIKERYPQVKIMRSIPIPAAGAKMNFPFLEIARLFEPVSDFFLTDTLLPEDENLSGQQQPVQGFVGITGKTCDWQSACRLVQTSRIPVILAGGLSPVNVADGIKQVGPAGVDSCTLTNLCDENGKPIRFKKDFDKVARFLSAARSA